ncbi:MAG: DUF1624 domain-containing protein [archaeon]|nr:DUF1624 domain-containing protein [archaeon]
MVNTRLKSIDFAKGLGMCAVISSHISTWYLDPNHWYFHGWIWLIFQFCGPIGYAVVTSIGVTISTRKKLENPESIQKSPLIGILKKSLIFFLIGFIFVNIGNFEGFLYITFSENFFQETIDAFLMLLDPTTLFRIHIFHLIGISQIVAYFVMKLKKRNRVILIILIIIFDFIICDVIVLGMLKETTFFSYNYFWEQPYYWNNSELIRSEALGTIYGWIYLLFFKEHLSMTIIPMIIIPITGTFVGDYIYEQIIPDKKKYEEMKENAENIDEINKITPKYKQIVYFGLFLILLGIILGSYQLEYYRGYYSLAWLNGGVNPPMHFDTIFAFLFTGTVPNLFFDNGITIFFIGLGVKVNDFRKIKPDPKVKGVKTIKRSILNPTKIKYNINKGFNNYMDWLSVFGRYSMTAYVMNYLLLPFVNPVYNPFELAIIYFTIIMVSVEIIYIWAKKFNGKYTLEDIFNK